MDAKETGKRAILILLLTLLSLSHWEKIYTWEPLAHRIKANKNKRQYHLKMNTETFVFSFINYDSQIKNQQ